MQGGPYHDLLHSVLGAYTCYRPDIGYVSDHTSVTFSCHQRKLSANQTPAFQVQGMSFIAAVLILNLEEAEAFITFANLLNKPCQMAFFRVDHELVKTRPLHPQFFASYFSPSSSSFCLLLLLLCQMLKYFGAFEVFFQENLPQLFSHFQSNNLTPDLYLIDW